MTPKKNLIACVKDLYYAGLTTSVSGNHSILLNNRMWITPSGVPRYLMTVANLVRVDVRTGIPVGKRKPSIESGMHRKIYLACPKIKAVVHTHSPFTIAVSISAEFRDVIEEARIVVGEPCVISNKPSGSDVLANAVAKAFRDGAAVVVVKNHGVVAAGSDIHQARSIVESLEEWSKILTITKIFGGARNYLIDD